MNGKEVLEKKEIHVYGRTDIMEDSLRFYYSASGFSFLFKGNIKLILTCNMSEDDVKRPYIVVFMNGKKERIALNSSKTELCFCCNKKSLFELFKSTEGSQSYIQVESLEVDHLYRHTQKQKKILFIGDSYTCGFGTLSHEESEPFLTKTEDVTETYGFYLARYFGFDMEYVAISGHGLQKSPWADKNMQEYFDQIAQDNPKKYCFKQDISYIVINLGTNDYFYYQDERNYEKRIEYTNGYIQFIHHLRSVYPKSKIICVGIDEERFLIDCQKDALKTVSDKNVYHTILEAGFDKDGRGAVGHPKKITHQRWFFSLKEFFEKEVF